MTITNVEFEQQILGGLIKDCQHSKSRESLDALSPLDFSLRTHSEIFRIIKLMSEQGLNPDLITINDAMANTGIDYGGFIYLAEIGKSHISHSNMGAYVAGLRKSSSLRELSAAMMSTSELINQGVDAQDIIEELNIKLSDISTNSNGRELKHISELTGNWLDLLTRRENAGGGILGVSTGYDELDERLGGFDEEGLIVIAGRPSHGKTLFCQALAQNVGAYDKQNLMFFSMEMSENQLYERFISGLSNVDPKDLRQAKLGSENLGRIDNGINYLASSGIYIDAEQGLSVGQIRAKVRRHKAKHPGLKMVMIDYLGLIKLGKADRHDIAIGNVTSALKGLAKEIKAPVVLIAQAKRGNDKSGSQPVMSDLKDSACIEADADVVIFINRPEISDPETELKGVTEIIIAKDRHNDGNGTIYMSKVNGTFIPLSTEKISKMTHDEQLRLNPPPEKKQRGYANSSK